MVKKIRGIIPLYLYVNLRYENLVRFRGDLL